jgi:hypothetical protein
MKTQLPEDKFAVATDLYYINVEKAPPIVGKK